MLSCNAISIARKKPAIRQWSSLQGDCICLYSLLMAFAMRLLLSAKLPTCLPALEIMSIGNGWPFACQEFRTFLKPAKTMTKLFADLPEAIANTLELSSRLEFTLEDLGYEFPKYSVPPGETMISFLRRRTEEGARLRYTGHNGAPTYEHARPQIERELALIEKLKLEGYFLIVWDIVQFCKQRGNFDSRARVGRKQCGLLLAGNYCR